MPTIRTYEKHGKSRREDTHPYRIWAKNWFGEWYEHGRGSKKLWIAKWKAWWIKVVFEVYAVEIRY